MQQYFIDRTINENDIVELREDIIYHLTKVLRDTNKTFRLVDINGDVFLCNLENKKAIVGSKLEENNELDVEITAIVSLIKSDKFELIIQKLTELGVKRIVPYNAKRSIVKETKADKKHERYIKIATEAAEQSHRNTVPEITNSIDLKDIKNYLSDINLVPYEKETNISLDSLKTKSITFVIGPEGGFDLEELEYIKSLGFRSISLGKRILRAETAAMYITSVIARDNEQ